MKKFLDKISPYGCLLPFVLVGLASIVGMFIGIWKFSEGNIWLFLFNLILIPFAVIGGINVFRGFGAVLEMDEAKFGHKAKGWKFYLYLLIHYGGYFALFYMIYKYI